MTITQLPSTQEGERPMVPTGDICRPPAFTSHIDVSGLVDARNGLVDRSVFTDRRLYEQELAR